MDLTLSFVELNRYVHAHYGKDIMVSYVSEKECKVTFTQRILIKKVHVSVNLHIDEVKQTEVTLTYDGGKAIDIMISGFISFIRNKHPELADSIKPGEHQKVHIRLARIDKVRPILKKTRLKDIVISPEELRLSAELK